MPYGSNSLPQNYINTIYYWIEQGAIGSDDNENNQCLENGFIEDCNDICFSENLLGDGNCNDGDLGEADFNCAEFIFDNTDCPVGNLEFGEITYNEGVGTLEILMDCEYPVSNFEIEISGVLISSASGGSSEEANFNILFSDSLLAGSVSESLDYIPANSGLLTILEYGNLILDQICFESSNITTYTGISYEAVLGDCIEISSELNGEDYLPIQTNINSIYPNPFNPITTINYSVYEPGFVEINIIDIKGRKIENIIKNYYSQGSYEISWNAINQPSGIYIVQLISGKNNITQKVVLTK